MFARMVGLITAVTLLAATRATGAQQSATNVAAARSRAVTGTVADPNGTPLANVEVGLVERDSISRRVRSDSRGRFQLDGLPSGKVTLRVRRVGFDVKNVTVDAATVDRSGSVFITLDPSVSVLDPMTTVEGDSARRLSPQLIAFYARARSNRLGYFIDEQKLEDLHPEHTSDALRSIPGVVVRPARIGNDVRIRGCAPLIWIDGLRAKGAQLDEITHGTDVAAIEVYESQAGVPAEFTDRSATCGTILVWLK